MREGVPETVSLRRTMTAGRPADSLARERGAARGNGEGS